MTINHLPSIPLFKQCFIIGLTPTLESKLGYLIPNVLSTNGWMPLFSRHEPWDGLGLLNSVSSRFSSFNPSLLPLLLVHSSLEPTNRSMC